MNNEYTIVWKEDPLGVTFPADQKEKAIEFYLEKIMEDAVDLIVIRPDGLKFCPPKKTGKKAFVIEAQFLASSKIYPYPAKFKPKKADTNLVVNSPYGIGIPKIVSVHEVDESALPVLCKTRKENLNWVLGSFKKEA